MRPLLLVGFVTACGPAGPRPARLDASKATAIEVATVADARRFCPGGESIQLAVAVATTDGKRLDTWSRGESRDGKLPFNIFEYTTSWGQIDGDGFVRLPDDPIAAIGRVVTVEVRVAERPDLVGTVSLEPDFGCGGTLGGIGATGASGWTGDGGHDGRPGAAGSDTSDGRDGERGGDAGHGSDGGPGGPGPRVEAAVAFVDTASGQRLVVLRTWADAGGAATTVFDPAGRAWGVVALGGDGGRGGSGGRGGAGGTGGSGTYKSSSGSSGSGSGSGSDERDDKPGTSGGNGGDGGRGGDGGNGGDGGPGGTITLVYDASFPALLDAIVVDNRGGRGGDAGWAGDGGHGGGGGSGERRGHDGRSGQAGRAGSRGRDGVAGPRPEIKAGDVRALFADLADRGLTVVSP